MSSKIVISCPTNLLILLVKYKSGYNIGIFTLTKFKILECHSYMKKIADDILEFCLLKC